MVYTVSKETVTTIGKSSKDGERQQKYAKMASSAQVLRGTTNVQTARRPFSNALQCQTARHSLRCGAGTVSSHRHRSIAVITAAKDSSRQGLEERTVGVLLVSVCTYLAMSSRIFQSSGPVKISISQRISEACDSCRHIPMAPTALEASAG